MGNEIKPDNLAAYIRSVEYNDTFDFEARDEKKPKPTLWKEIDALSFPEDRWLVPGIFPKEGISIVASVSGDGKSMLIMHLAKCISEGTAWFGNDRFKTQKARVLYVNLEMSVSEMQRRGRLVGFDGANEDLIILNEDDFNLNPPGLGADDLKYKWLVNFVNKRQIKVVIIDTFRAVAGGLKEEKAEDVRAFFKKFQIFKNSGVSIIFLEHVRKPTQLEGKVPKKEQVLGSQDKTANAEVLLMMRRDESSGEHHIYQRKNRLGVEAAPFAVKISDTFNEGGSPSLAFEYVGEIEDDVNKKEAAKTLVLDILSDGDLKDRKQLAELTKKHVGSKNLNAALKELVTLGEIDMVKDGKKHCFFVPKGEVDFPEESLAADKSASNFDPP